MKIWIITLSLCAASLYASQPPINIAAKLGTRSLIILCDEYEALEKDPKLLQANSRLLITALENHSSPILVNTSVWQQLLKSQQKGLTKNLPKGSVHYKSGTGAIQPGDFYFQPADWKVYASSDLKMLLFIPQNGLRSNKNEMFIFDEYLNQLNLFTADQSKMLSDGELLLGIKLRKLKPVDDPINIASITITSETVPSATTQTQLSLSINLKQYLNQILVTHADLKNLHEDLLNGWDIFLAGHGDQHNIGGISVSHFEQLLDFLNRTIKTRSIFIVSCYAGAHLEKPYQININKEIREKQFNFLIILSSPFNLPTSYPNLINPNAFTSYFNLLNKYFEGGTQSKNSLTEAVDNFTLLLGAFNRDAIITIRAPHTEWFSIPANQNAFILNDSIITRAINKHKYELPINEEMIIIESYYIPLTLKIYSHQNLELQHPLFMPTKISNASYYFKELHILHRTLAEFIQTFKPFHTHPIQSTEKPNIMFYIEKLIIQGHDFKNVIIKPGDFIYLEENGKAYTLSFDVTAPWQPGYLGNTSYEAAKALAHDFKNAKEAIRKKSTLPASMIADIPTSINEPPLSYKFLAYKSQPQKMAEFMNTLSPNQKERFEKLIIFNIADAMLGHQYFLYKHDARQLTQWQNRLSQADKAHLEHIEGLWSQYQANKDDDVKFKSLQKITFTTRCNVTGSSH